ncbi:unnamed protein product [Durusdinium trenchii]|uniref:Protein kinase domain-containing protein n=1 Tax=Durusdinium trenchii TaxID=1381693 RepID=A0ABP0QUU8_9DINO
MACGMYWLCWPWHAQRMAHRDDEVIVKFHCCQEECQNGKVCSGESSMAELRYECEAGFEAFQRAPDLVAACLDDPKMKPPKPFIVLKDVGSYFRAQSFVTDFLADDQRSNHTLLRQVLRAVHAFLVPRDGRSLVHMDLTMANIMWDPKTLAVQLIDFSQVEFCKTLMWNRASPMPGRCIPKQLLKDLKKEVLHLALLVDLYGSSEQKRCSKQVTRINFEKRRAQRKTTLEYVTDALQESCLVLISPWTWSFIDWLSHLDRRILRQLDDAEANSSGIIFMNDIFQDFDQPAWSFHDVSKLYDINEL